MQKVREVFGDDAVVLSTKPAPEGGIEIMAMGADAIAAIENLPAEHHQPAAKAPVAARVQSQQPARQEPQEPKADKQPSRNAVAALANSVQDDVRQLAMSTLSFQDYVRERMLKRRQAAIKSRMEPEMAQSPEEQLAQRVMPTARAAASLMDTPDVDTSLDLSAPSLRLVKGQTPANHQAQREAAAQQREDAYGDARSLSVQQHAGQVQAQAQAQRAQQQRQQAEAEQQRAAREREQQQRGRQAGWSDPAELTMGSMVARTQVPAVAPNGAVDEAAREALVAAQAANASMLNELRAMREMMKERFETIAFVEKLQRTPTQALVAQRLLDGGFSPVLVRKMLDGMPKGVAAGKSGDMNWAAQVLQRNLNTGDQDANIEDQGGVFALVGSTGVGKTTTTAKLAALFAAKHGAQNLGLITLDAYRMGAHEQLRAYGRILGVPVHIAHDRAALEDLLELLSGKKLILIDTAGMPQRDARTRELLEMISHKSIKKLLVINTAAQGDAIEDVMVSYQAASCAGVILSKLDEAVKLGPALDALIRHKLKVIGVANGQRVPEDWHRLTAASLVHRAIRASLNPAYRLDPSEVSLVFATPEPVDALSASSSV
ncbi:MAG: flagellar biosynthesis protein FlhF [Rubrivivax sp.]|nr:MAG: flagellar biosynthesis protein FlhF [Rubrivivax sp.]